jgi:hypothetical protein
VSTHPPPRKDNRPDAVRPGVLLLIFSALLLAALVAWWALHDAPETPVAQQLETPRPAPRPRAPPLPTDDLPPVAEAPATPNADVDQPDPGPSGLQLYSPNAKPIRRGLVVPEGYVLPPGYVRHFQANDDGTLLPPILTFHPDFQPVDDAGRPVKVAEGRVVPPELAPAGFPLHQLEVPTPDFTDLGAEPLDGGR